LEARITRERRGEVLQSLRSELLSEKQTLEERIVKIDTILSVKLGSTEPLRWSFQQP
jgi:hypothetical protein